MRINVFALLTISGHGGDKGSRTPDLLLARQALSQLSYAPGYFRIGS